MISAGVKSNIKQEIKDLVAAFYKLLSEVPSKLQIQWIQWPILEKNKYGGGGEVGVKDILF